MAQIMSIRGRALQSRDAIELLSSKWRIPIIHLLRDEPLRTSQIQAGVSEVSPKVLTQTLRSMERDGLILRKVHAAVPPKVEYSLTPMGASLLDTLAGLCHWAQAHVRERDDARARFDMQRAGSVRPSQRRASRR